MTVQQAIENANALLPGSPLSNDEEIDPRWQAIIEVGNYVESNPKEVWEFITRWGKSESEDVRTAIGTCLLEHLLQYHFSTYFPRVESLAGTDPLFGDTFLSLWEIWAKREAK